MEHKTNSGTKQTLNNKQTNGKWIKEPWVAFQFPWQPDKQAEIINQLKNSHPYTLHARKYLNNKDDNQTEWQSTDKLTPALQVQNQLFYSWCFNK